MSQVFSGQDTKAAAATDAVEIINVIVAEARQRLNQRLGKGKGDTEDGGGTATGQGGTSTDTGGGGSTPKPGGTSTDTGGSSTPKPGVSGDDDEDQVLE